MWEVNPCFGFNLFLLQLHTPLSYKPAKISVPIEERGAEWPNHGVDIDRGETIISYTGYAKQSFSMTKIKQQ